MQDGPTESLEPHNWEGGDAKVRYTREEFIHQTRQASTPATAPRTGQEPSAVFACKTRLRKLQHRNHKGEDGAVFPEEKQRFLLKAEVRALFISFPTMKKESYFPLIWIIFSMYDSASMPSMSVHVFSPA